MRDGWVNLSQPIFNGMPRAAAHGEMRNLGPGLATVAGRRVEVMAVPFAIEGGDASPVVPLARSEDLAGSPDEPRAA